MKEREFKKELKKEMIFQSAEWEKIERELKELDRKLKPELEKLDLEMKVEFREIEKLDFTLDWENLTID